MSNGYNACACLSVDWGVIEETGARPPHTHKVLRSKSSVSCPRARPQQAKAEAKAEAKAKAKAKRESV